MAKPTASVVGRAEAAAAPTAAAVRPATAGPRPGRGPTRRPAATAATAVASCQAGTAAFRRTSAAARGSTEQIVLAGRTSGVAAALPGPALGVASGTPARAGAGVRCTSAPVTASSAGDAPRGPRRYGPRQSIFYFHHFHLPRAHCGVAVGGATPCTGRGILAPVPVPT